MHNVAGSSLRLREQLRWLGQSISVRIFYFFSLCGMLVLLLHSTVCRICVLLPLHREWIGKSESYRSYSCLCDSRCVLDVRIVHQRMVHAQYQCVFGIDQVDVVPLLDMDRCNIYRTNGYDCC